MKTAKNLGCHCGPSRAMKHATGLKKGKAKNRASKMHTGFNKQMNSKYRGGNRGYCTDKVAKYT